MPNLGELIMSNYMYPACFYPEDDGQYSVIFPDLEGIATYGNDIEDAIRMATDLLCVWVLESRKNNGQLPKASNVKDVKPNDENGFVNLIVADVDAYIRKNNKSIKKTLSIPAWLNEIAEKEGVNFSQVLQGALKKQLRIGA
jgi:predicted RNase H-like HicB family nuclease